MSELTLKDYNVTMSNSLIRASHGLSLTEKRVIALAVATIDSRKGNLIHAHLSEYQQIKITAKDFANAYGISDKIAYRDLKKATEHIFERQLSMRSDDNKMIRFRWVSSIAYKNEQGFVELSFTPEIYPHLNLLRKQYTTYKLKKTESIKSAYSWRLFELAKSWSNQNKGKTVKITLDNLKHIFTTPENYLWSDLRKRALIPAIKEIETLNLFKIEYSIEKKGRAVHAINFKFIEIEEEQDSDKH